MNGFVFRRSSFVELSNIQDNFSVEDLNASIGIKTLQCKLTNFLLNGEAVGYKDLHGCSLAPHFLPSFFLGNSGRFKPCLGPGYFLLQSNDFTTET